MYFLGLSKKRKILRLIRIILTSLVAFTVPRAESNIVTYRHFLENGVPFVEETMVIGDKTTVMKYALPEQLPANNPYLNPSYNSQGNAIPLQPIYQGTVIDTAGVKTALAPTIAPLPTAQPLPTLQSLPTLPAGAPVILN